MQHKNIHAAVLAAALAGAAAQAAEPKRASVPIQAQLKQVLERLQQLEARNQELERRVQELSKAGAASPPVAQASAPSAAQVEQIERQQQALQAQVQSMAARPVESASDAAEEGLKIEAGALLVAQRINAGGSADGRSQTRLGWRGDLLARMPAGAFGSSGASRGTAVAHLRFGQGSGVATRPTYTGAVNTTAFEVAGGSQETYAILAEAYYQLDVPLDGGRFNDQAGNRIEVQAGKLDLFTVFDQNAVAGDEAKQFLNNVFVHNPLLDSGGDIAADAYGFAPGARIAYVNEGERSTWGASLGVFGAGPGATFNALGRPLVIAQTQWSPKQINGNARGTYRAYAWTNGQTTDLAGNRQRHSGVGVSADQRVGRDWNLFGRWGQRTRGDGAFDRALTVGFEHGGRAWRRGHDSIGLALGGLKTDRAWRDATALDPALAGFAAGGTEWIAELYYRARLNEHLEITPDYQLIRRAGGDRSAPAVHVLGVRANVSF